MPFKQNIFSLVKFFGTPPEKIFQHLHFVGIINIRSSENTNFKMKHYGFQIENEIYWRGIENGWEKVSLTIWAELCTISKSIFDIGANTGIYSLLAKSIAPDAKVYAFEPVERVFEKLVYNNKLNSYDIACSNEAISDYTGEATIYDKDTEHTYSVTVNEDNSDNKETSIPTIIQTIRLDEFIESNCIEQIDLIKIDVEKHEVEALRGMGKYISSFMPTFLIEILNDEIAKGVEDILKEMDYEYYIIDENSGIAKVEHLRKSDYYNFLICTTEVAHKLKSIPRFTKEYKNKN